jgi:hypothetical protein
MKVRLDLKIAEKARSMERYEKKFMDTLFLEL